MRKPSPPPSAAPLPLRGKIDLTHVDDWLFDLDNTLYPLDSGLMALMEEKMSAVVARIAGLSLEEASTLRAALLTEFGSTTYGMIRHYGIDPLEFLYEVHDVPLDVVTENAPLRETLLALPGRRLIFTNADDRHTERVLEKLGLEGVFDDIFHIGMADFVPKPDLETFTRMAAHHDLTPAATAFFEDSARNLKPAHDLGMTTVLVAPNALETQDAFVHHRTTDLTAFLSAALTKD